MVQGESSPHGREADASATEPTRSTDAFLNAVRESGAGMRTLACTFLRSARFWSRANFGLRKRGQITVSDGKVTVRGRLPLYALRIRDHCTFDLDRVYNVQRTGRCVYMAVAADEPDESRQIVMLRTESIMDAQRLVDMLPDTTQPGPADPNAELLAFRGNLVHVGEVPFITPAIVLINVAVYVVMCFAGIGILHANTSKAIDWGSNFGPLVAAGQWWRLLTSMFVHFGLMHIAVNMIVLMRIGPMIERIFGYFRFAAIYLLAGLTGSLASLLMHPAVNSAGASGAIFGIVGAFLAFVIRPRNGLPRSVILTLGAWILAFTALSLKQGFSDPAIDIAAHIGGLLGGFLMGLMLARPLTAQAHARKGTRPALAGVAAGLCGLAILAIPVLHPSPKRRAHLQFEEVLHRLPPIEHEAVRISKILTSTEALNELDPQTLSMAYYTRVVPQWAYIVNTVSAPKLDPSDADYPLQKAMVRYYSDRRNLFQLLSNAYHDQYMGHLDESTFKARAGRINTDILAAKKRLDELAKARKKAQQSDEL